MVNIIHQLPAIETFFEIVNPNMYEIEVYEINVRFYTFLGILFRYYLMFDHDK